MPDVLTLLGGALELLLAAGGGGLLGYYLKLKRFGLKASDQDLKEIRAGREAWRKMVEQLEKRVTRLEDELENERNLRTTAELRIARYRVREQYYRDRVSRLQCALSQHQDVPSNLKGPIEAPDPDQSDHSV